MLVVADASPLNYLIQIQCDYCLPRLYSRVLAPRAVIDELRHPGAPTAVAAWLRALPDWLEIRSIARPTLDLEHLDAGEREAIELAIQEHANLLLIDDRVGRLEADRRGITTTGTLGVLLAADIRGFLNAEVEFRSLLTNTNFRADFTTRESFLARLRHLREGRT